MGQQRRGRGRGEERVEMRLQRGRQEEKRRPQSEHNARCVPTHTDGVNATAHGCTPRSPAPSAAPCSSRRSCGAAHTWCCGRWGRRTRSLRCPRTSARRRGRARRGTSRWMRRSSLRALALAASRGRPVQAAFVRSLRPSHSRASQASSSCARMCPCCSRRSPARRGRWCGPRVRPLFLVAF